MKVFIFRCFALMITVLILVSAIPTISAENSEYVPYESYTYWQDISGFGRKIVLNKPMFTAGFEITAQNLSVERFTELIDICTDNSGNIYLLDSNSKIVILDKNYNFIKEITEIKGAENFNFIGAQSVYVHNDGTIYICDTSNNRVLHCDFNGSYIDMFTKPNSPLIPADFSFQPIKAAVDSRGYVYVLCKGSYYGALLYAPDKSFIGFYGANSVTNGILDALQSLWKRMFPNSKKASKSVKMLPYSFNDIIVDGEDFVYTVTDSASEAQIKKLNPGAGNNILGSENVNFADDEVNRTYLGYSMPQRFVSVAVDQNDFIYCLDAAYGRIYLYDSSCRMITAFGGGMGVGAQLGTFSSATALALNDDDVLVCDKSRNTVTVFHINSYGKKVKSLLYKTLQGKYKETKQGWEEVIIEDKNLQLAYNGLARACLAEKQYSEAMEIALEGYDRETYAMAYKYLRRAWVSDNFFWIFGGAVLILGTVLALIAISMKRKNTFIKNEELRLIFSTLFHPGISFETIKDKHKGSIRISIGIFLLFYVTAVIKEIAGGFLFTGYSPENFNSIWMFIQSMGIVILWIVSNILVCQILEGNGTVREIIIVTSYSLMPIIIERILWTVLTNILLPEESTFLGVFSVISLIWSGLLLIIGMMRIHEFSFGKFVGTTALSLFGMAVIAFLMVLVGILLQQFGGFIVTVITELLY